MEALRRFRAGELDAAAVVDVVRESRFLIPLLATLGDSEIGDHGHLVDKTQELSIVTVTAPDGRNVLPVFSSVAAMTAWNPVARPVPADAVRIALAAASEHTDLVVIDPTSESEFVLRRPALWAIAQSLPWVPSYLDEAVADAVVAAATAEPAVRSVALAPGDPEARLAGPELVVRLTLIEGLTRPQLDAVLARVQAGWSRSEVIASHVDSMSVRLVAAG